jgi:tetratricopeptide (TPR) repeat protein
LETQGLYQDAIDDFASAAELLDGDDEAAAQSAHARSRQAMVLHKAGQFDAAETIATAALQRWAGRSEPALLRAYGRLEQALGHVAAHNRDFERAAHHYEAAISWVERAGDLIGVAMATVSMGNLAFRARNLNKAESLYRDAVRQFRSLDLATGRAMAQTNLGNVLLEQGRFVEALKQLGEAESTVRKAGSADMLPEVLRLVAACSLALGEVARAGEVANEAVERAQGLGNEALLAAARTTFRKVKQASQVIERITVSDDGLSPVLHEGDDTMPYVRGPAPADPSALEPKG